MSKSSKRVASVGSPSSNYDVTLELSKEGRETPMVGTMLSLENKMGEGSELALGTVTEVTTLNRWHQDPAFRGAVNDEGMLTGMSGDDGDIRTATIRLQAAWRKDEEGDPWKASGPNLRMSPATGTSVNLVDDALVKELTEATEDLHYMGHLGGTKDVRLPFNIPDFSGPAGAFSGAVYGQSGSGKAVALDTPILTSEGWSTMGEIKDGDKVFDEEGNLCNIVKAHDILLNRDCYEVVFSDGSKIIADGEHLWETESHKIRSRKGTRRYRSSKENKFLPKDIIGNLREPISNAGSLNTITINKVSLTKLCEKTHNNITHHLWKEIAPSIVTTKEILDTLRVEGPNAYLNHAIKVAQPVVFMEKALPIHPYVLGCYLGDGDSRQARICGIDNEIARHIEGYGFIVTESKIQGKHPDFRWWKVEGLSKLLRESDLLQSTTQQGSQKHIPALYLISSIAQRRMLLAGLLDTDGSVDTYGGVTFFNTNKNIADGVFQIAASLGYRPTMNLRTQSEKEPNRKNGWTVAWRCPDSPFFLSRKTATHTARNVNYNPIKNSYRYISEVNKVDSVPVRCITVDSPSHLYLIGKSLIPTHNTQVATLYIAGQMRNEGMGVIVVDPQGQWASERGNFFSLQGFAEEMGRDVRVHRISTDLRLAKDAPLLTQLLQETRLVVELGLKSESTQDLVFYEITKALRIREDWTKDLSSDLLKSLLEYLKSDDTSGRIYITPDNRKAFVDRVDGVLNDAGLFADALNQFAPIHNLFQETNASGAIRYDLWRTISEVFDRPQGVPAPFLVLDMSSAAIPGMEEEVSEAFLRSQEILEKDSIKAAILRNLFSTLKRASEDKFRKGTNLNTLVVLDEAWRYAAPTNKGDDEQLTSLSKDLAGYARDTRKFGIGWLYISQTTKSINLDIWDQLVVRIFGYGLSGGDIEKIAEIVDDRNALRLYRTFGNPRATGVYPFMITGPVSPLAANSTPLILNAYTDFDAFREDNHKWIKALRDKIGKPILSGLPIAPKGSAAGPKPTVRKIALPKDMRGAIVDTNKAIRENQRAVGVKDTAGFGDPLSQLENEGIEF